MPVVRLPSYMHLLFLAYHPSSFLRNSRYTSESVPFFAHRLLGQRLCLGSNTYIIAQPPIPLHDIPRSPSIEFFDMIALLHTSENGIVLLIGTEC